MKWLKPALVNSSPAFNCLVKQFAKERIEGVLRRAQISLTLWGPRVQLFPCRCLMSSHRPPSLPGSEPPDLDPFAVAQVRHGQRPVQRGRLHLCLPPLGFRQRLRGPRLFPF